MGGDIITQSIQLQTPNALERSEQAQLTEDELVSLRLFVTRLGDRIVEDTSPFTSTERNRLAFLTWLYAHGKLLH
jgi:hypothetical protein